MIVALVVSAVKPCGVSMWLIRRPRIRIIPPATHVHAQGDVGVPGSVVADLVVVRARRRSSRPGSTPRSPSGRRRLGSARAAVSRQGRRSGRTPGRGTACRRRGGSGGGPAASAPIRRAGRSGRGRRRSSRTSRSPCAPGPMLRRSHPPAAVPAIVASTLAWRRCPSGLTSTSSLRVASTNGTRWAAVGRVWHPCDRRGRFRLAGTPVARPARDHAARGWTVITRSVGQLKRADQTPCQGSRHADAEERAVDARQRRPLIGSAQYRDLVSQYGGSRRPWPRRIGRAAQASSARVRA